MHPVLESLRNTDRQWLIDTLYAFNSGNVEKFQALKSAWGQQVGGWFDWLNKYFLFDLLVERKAYALLKTAGIDSES